MPPSTSMAGGRLVLRELAGEDTTGQAGGGWADAALRHRGQLLVVPRPGRAELPDDLGVLVQAHLVARRGDDPSGEPVGLLAGQVEGHRSDVVRGVLECLLRPPALARDAL